MNTITYMTELGDLYWPSVIAALAIATIGGIVSVFVVLKRLAFVGQGVSHAAFGGVGLALALSAMIGVAFSQALIAAIVLGFSVIAALVIERLGRTRPGRESHARTDSAIGIVLAASMGLGFILYGYATRHAPPSAPIPDLESVLFGDILGVRWTNAIVSIGVLAIVSIGVWWIRRALIMWSFDEQAARVMGVRTERIASVFMVLLAIGVVSAVQLAGIVLATAVFVLPGASALRVSHKLTPVFVLSITISIVGTLLGIVLGFELDWAIGPSIVCVQCVLYALCRAFGRVRS